MDKDTNISSTLGTIFRHGRRCGALLALSSQASNHQTPPNADQRAGPSLEGSRTGPSFPSASGEGSACGNHPESIARDAEGTAAPVRYGYGFSQGEATEIDVEESDTAGGHSLPPLPPQLSLEESDEVEATRRRNFSLGSGSARRGSGSLRARGGIHRRVPPARARVTVRGRRGAREVLRSGGAVRVGARGDVGASTGRGTGFCEQEVSVLLNLLEEHLPIARMEWDTVASLHNLRFPGTDRTVDSLRRKLTSLHRRRVPTGDPHIPGDVLLAKRIKHQITERADMGDDDDMVDDTDDFDDDNDGDGGGGARSSIVPASENATTGYSQPTEPATPGSAGHSSSTPSPFSLPRPLHPRPIVNRRGLPGRATGGPDGEMVTLYKLLMIQEHERREHERVMREEERREERDRREEERREHQLRRESELQLQREENRRAEQRFESLMMMAGSSRRQSVIENPSSPSGGRASSG